MRAVINIHGTRDLHNECSAARRRAAPRSAARHFAALIALVSTAMLRSSARSVNAV